MVKPCELYDDMVVGVLEGSIIRVQGSAFSLGHWFPANDEMAPIDEAADDHSEWVPCTDCGAPTVEINVEKGVIELQSHEQFLSFRFKSLASPLELCYEESLGYSLIFRLKHPPKLEKEEGVERQRATDWNSVAIKEFGRSLGYKIVVTKLAVNGILLHKLHDKLKRFGVINIDAVELATPIVSRESSTCFDKLIDKKIRSLGKPRIQLMLQALLGHGKFCSYHVLNEPTPPGRGFIDSLAGCPVDPAVEALEKMMKAHGTTKYPSRVLRTLLLSMNASKDSGNALDYCVSIPRLLLSPSRSLVLGFEVEMSNRVIRMFIEEKGFNEESFLRVQIADENGLKIYDRDLTGRVEAL